MAKKWLSVANKSIGTYIMSKQSVSRQQNEAFYYLIQGVRQKRRYATPLLQFTPIN